MNPNDPTKLTSFQPLAPVTSTGDFSLTRFFNFSKKKLTSTQSSSKLLVTPDNSRESSPEFKRPQALAISADHAKTNFKKSGGKVEVREKNMQAWMTESAASHTKLFGSKELVPESQLATTVSQGNRKDKWRYRNVRTILRRISTLTIDRRWHQSTGDFKHNVKQYWMPDEHCKECYECNGKFNTFRRRHHCRVCGQIFCSRCCNQEVPGKVMGFSGDIRVCNYCHKIVQAYLNDDFEKNIEALSEDMKACEPGYPYEFGGSSSSINSSSKSSFHIDDHGFSRIKRSGSANNVTSPVNQDRRSPTLIRSPFDAFGVAPSEANVIKQDYLRELWHQITDSRNGLELQSLRHRLKTYDNCLVGNELCDWLLNHNKANTRFDAIIAGQGLVDNGWLEHVSPLDHEPVFKDEYILYQPTKMALSETALWMALISPFPTDDSDESDCERGASENNLANLDIPDDDCEAPFWFRQMTTTNSAGDVGGNTALTTGSQTKRFTTGRHLDLDLGHQVVDSVTDKQKAELSIQMKLDSQKTNNETNEIKVGGEGSKISFITHAPPLPLDTYVCVEGHQTTTKKKTIKPNNSSSNISEDILHGVIFPRPDIEIETVCDGNNDDISKDESGERLAKDRLSVAAQHHIHAFLEQLLKQDNLLPSWENIILPFILKVSEKVIPDVRRDDDMDIRRYVWFTKVPGGLKTDCHFISGVVFTKNVAHKRMNDTFTQPRILMMSCSIEYQRVENKMSSLDPLVLQEQAFLQNFVKRVLALKPNLFLVEKNVARVAQDMLLAGGVTLVHNIKSAMMENIARCTGADILQTMEQVRRPKLGTCQVFKLQKYTMPNGKIKTLMYLEGCAPDLGCSLILRGGNEKTLMKVKRILKFLIYVAYHLKLETKFLMDEFAMPPPLDGLMPRSKLFDELTETVTEISTEDVKENQLDTSLQVHQESYKFRHALHMINLSSSPFCCYSMPYLLTEQGTFCPNRDFIAKEIYWSRYLDGSVNEPSKLIEDDHEWIENEVELSPDIILKEAHPFTDPTQLIDCFYDPNKKAAMLNNFRACGGRVDLKMYHEYEELERKKMFGVYYDSTFKRDNDADYEEDDDDDIVEEGIDENVIVDTNVDLRDPKHDCFDAYNHEKIAVLFSSYSSESHNAPKPCISPWAVFMEFYRRNDITLGGFLERYCFRPSYICPSHNCDVPMVSHVRYFAHGNGSLFIHMRNLESPIPGYDRTILTWSWCKLCKQVTPVVPLSFESWSMSFAKYLELRFYASGYTRRASVEPCGHSLHHDHFQYFSFANMVASFKYRAISLYEVIIPSDKILIGKQRNPKQLLNEVADILETVENVTLQIMERIISFKSVDVALANTSREVYLSDLHKELQKEQHNMQDVMSVIKTKTELLVSAKHPTSSSSISTSTGSSSQSESLKSRSASTLSSSNEEKVSEQINSVDGKGVVLASSLSKGVVLQPTTEATAVAMLQQQRSLVQEMKEMTDDEINLLMVDIGNKVFHLKKNICSSVENWNVKLQEFASQDKKREKSGVVPPRAGSPVKQPSITTDVTEFYPEPTVEMDPARPRPITHMHPEPVSEVFIDGGKILRQTYFGTTPSVSPFHSEDVVDSPIRSRKSSGNNYSNLTKSVDVNKTTKDLNINVSEANDKNNLNEFDENIQNKVGSPYMVILSPSYSNSNSNEILKSENIDTEKIKSKPMDELRAVLDSSPVDNWLASERDRSSTIINRFKLQHEVGLSGSEQSLLVEYDSDNNIDLSDNQSSNENDYDESNLPESEVQSEVEVVEEGVEEATSSETNDEDLIQVGQSAVDFRESRSRSSRRSLLAYTEFPKIKEELIEKIEYLTPKEVKAMQTARRRKSEWERYNKDRLTPTKELSLKVKEPSIKKTETLVKTTEYLTKSKEPSIKSKNTVPQISETEIIEKKDKSRRKITNPLIKRLIQNIEGSSDKLTGKGKDKSDKNEKPKTGNVKVLKQSDKSIINKLNEKTNFQPIQSEKSIDEVDHPLKVSSRDNSPTLDFNKKKALGHRRMKSAPLQKRKKIRDFEVPSDLTPTKPFVYLTSDHLNVNDAGEFRERSRSLDTKREKKGQKELSKMAELVCNEDQIDAERDDPEVLQCKTIKSPQTDKSPLFFNSKQTVMKQNSNSSLADTENTEQNNTNQNTKKSKNELDVPDGKPTEGGISKREGSEKMKKIINHFHFFSATFQPIPRPFPSSEQYMTQFGVTSSIVINEKEPTSLIAFTLSSQEYVSQLNSIQDLMAGKIVQPRNLTVPAMFSQPSTPNTPRKLVQTLSDSTQKIVSPLALGPDDNKGNINFRGNITRINPRPSSWAGSTDTSLDTLGTELESLANVDATLKRVNVGRQHPLSSTTDFDNEEAASIENEELTTSGEGTGLEESGSTNTNTEDSRKKSSTPTIDYHIKLQFSNNVAKFYCSVYYAEQFRQLRQLIFPEGEERFIQSLARCKFWKATGGKSGSSFSKSLDDRFVMKQMSRPEVQSFVDFAPRYFAYINKAFNEKRPTAMAKLLGVYRIGFKNSITNTTMRQDVLVMENLFYEKKVHKIFDLKGSVRSRYVHNSAKDDVLMDENLLEMIRESPLFIRPHSKAILSKAIYNDTEFLSTNMVMDYSLLVGIDEAKSELVVGIIDYIRTYTWDKKLENYVKSTGILGGQGKMPTVVSPDLYRTRFTEAMQRYFLMVPDKWTGFGADLN